jgi:hypothetical protein
MKQTINAKTSHKTTINDSTGNQADLTLEMHNMSHGEDGRVSRDRSDKALVGNAWPVSSAKWKGGFTKMPSTDDEFRKV